MQRTTTCANANYKSWFLSHDESGAPRHKHVQLEGQFRSLVHILCVWQEFQWSWLSAIIFIAGDSHISYLYICHGHIYISFYHCTDIWPQLRTQCAGEEAVPSTCVGGARPCAGRGATRARSAAPRRPRQVRANQVHPCTCGRWGATAPALEARQRCKQVRWKRP